MPSVCMRKDCEKPATHKVSMALRAKFGGAAAYADLNLVVCYECGDKLKVKDVLTSEGWTQIVQGCHHAGKAKPKRSLTTVVLTALEVSR